MGENTQASEADQVRNGILVALQKAYPGRWRGELFFQAMAARFPRLTWDEFNAHLAALANVGYVHPIIADEKTDALNTLWCAGSA